MPQYLSNCYETYENALSAVCANMPVIASDGAFLSCVPGVSNITFSRELSGSVNSSVLTPAFQECTVYSSMYMDLVSELWILPVTAIVILLVRRMVR